MELMTTLKGSQIQNYHLATVKEVYVLGLDLMMTIMECP